MRATVLVLALATVITLACTQPETRRMTDIEQRAAQAGADYIARQYPDFDKTRKTLAVRDLGNQWEVTYDLPDDMLGGAPVVVLDKATLAVARSYRTQ